jgi:hypothetical protein
MVAGRGRGCRDGARCGCGGGGSGGGGGAGSRARRGDGRGGQGGCCGGGAFSVSTISRASPLLVAPTAPSLPLRASIATRLSSSLRLNTSHASSATLTRSRENPTSSPGGVWFSGCFQAQLGASRHGHGSVLGHPQFTREFVFSLTARNAAQTADDAAAQLASDAAMEQGASAVEAARAEEKAEAEERIEQAVLLATQASAAAVEAATQQGAAAAEVSFPGRRLELVGRRRELVG